MKSFTAGPNDVGARLSRFVLNVTQNLPSSVLYKGFRNKRIKVNGKRAQADYRLAEGDVVELYLNDEFFPQAPGKIGHFLKAVCQLHMQPFIDLFPSKGFFSNSRHFFLQFFII